MGTRFSLTRKLLTATTVWTLLFTRALPVATIAVGVSAATSGTVFANPAVGCPATPIGSPYTGKRLTYGGGIVQHNTTLYAIYWLPSGYHFEFGVGSSDQYYEHTIENFFRDVKHTNIAGTIAQYYDCSGGTQETIEPTLDFGGSWTDTRTYDSDGYGNDGSPGHPLNSRDMRDEIAHAQLQNPSWKSGRNATFVVFTGASDAVTVVNVCADDYDTQCTAPAQINLGNDLGNVICGYHEYNDSRLGGGPDAVYAVIPDEAVIVGCNNIALGPNMDTAAAYADNTIDATAHEVFEAETDPEGTPDFWTNTGDGSGFLRGEVADQCENDTTGRYGYAAYHGGQANTEVGTHDYELPQMWSNLDGRCSGNYAGPAGFFVTNGDFTAFAGQSTGELRLAESSLSMANPTINWGDGTGNSSSVDLENPPGLVGDCKLLSHCIIKGRHTYSRIGTYRVTISYGVVCRTDGCIVDSTSTYVMVLPAKTSLSYTGDTSADYNDAATLSAKLAGSSGGAISGQTINFQLGSDSCAGTTDSNGDASCTVSAIGEASGSYTATATYAGDTDHTGSSTSSSFTVKQEDSSISYTGPTSAVYSHPVTVSARLFDTVDNTPISGKSVTLTLGGTESCTAITDENGAASCSITPREKPGQYNIQATFLGDGYTSSALDTQVLTVNKVTPFMSHVGPSRGDYNDPVTVMAMLTDPVDNSPLSGISVTFTLNDAETCTASTASDGTVSCSITPKEDAARYRLTVSYSGDDFTESGFASIDFTVIREDTKVAYTGPASQSYNHAVTLSANLKDRDDNAAISGKSLTFTLNGAETCTAPTDADGAASCSINPQENAGLYTLTVSFAGDSNYAPSSTSPRFTVNPADTLLTYTGPTSQDYNDSMTVSAKLTDKLDNTPVAGKSVTFTLAGADTCTATTLSDGTVSCTITPQEKAGPYTLKVSFAGDSTYAASSVSPSFTVKVEEDTLTASASLQLLPSGSADTLTSILKEDGTTGIQGRSVKMTLGSGASAVSCTGTTDASGTASCTVTPPAALQGPQTITDTFTSDGYYTSASTTQQALVFGFVSPGSFLLGDKTVANATATTQVNWWGSQWSKNNSVTAAPSLSGLKGFAMATTPTRPTCGGTWTSPANTTPVPPAASNIPAYMAVIVTSKVTLSSTSYSGDIKRIVIVKTLPGYQPSPGKHGNGYVVASYCGG